MKHLKKFNESKGNSYTLDHSNLKSILSKFASDFLKDYEKEHVGAPGAMVDEWISDNMMSYKNYSHQDLKK